MEANEVKQFLLHLAECLQNHLTAFRTSRSYRQNRGSFFDPVTDIDLKLKSITNEIKARFPEHGISGEYGTVGSQDRWSWIIDPIDGTRSFISGMPTWGT